MRTYLEQNDHCDRRGGFTVVEILIAITVIAILAAMLIPVVGGAMRRANEFAIQAEMTQLDMAIEQFKNDNGFYPPSFKGIELESAGSPLTPDQVLMPYLNRIAPNHAYTQAQLADWWNKVGEHIEHHAGADLVFWLSGISKNKQYPLGPPNNWLAPHSFDPNSNDERNVYFEFASSRLTFDHNNRRRPANYLQAKGKPAPYQYIDARHYGPADVTVAVPDFHGYHSVVNGERQFFNPNTFQLVAFGLDGLPGGDPTHHGTADCGFLCTGFVSPANLTYDIVNRPQDGSGMDNIVNFVGEGSGKLETKALGVD